MTHDPLFDIGERVCVITGASSGIGAALASFLAERGARVVLAARRLDVIEQQAKDLPQAVAVRCDVTVDANCRNLVDVTLGTYGQIDVLINNAGTHVSIPAENEAVPTFRSVIETNLTATFAMSHYAAVPMLSARTGSIINVASVFGFAGCGAFPVASYAASKAGVVNLTRELAAQWGRRGIRVNAIAPSYFESEMTAEALANAGTHRFVTKRTPLRRIGRLEELCGPVLLLASDAGSYVTGTTIAVDGGWTAI